MLRFILFAFTNLCISKINPVSSFAMNIEDIQLNDLLNRKYVSFDILLNEFQKYVNNSSDSRKLFSEASNSTYYPNYNNIDVGTALKMMGYHRRKMNEFLTLDFVTQQILSDQPLMAIGKRKGMPAQQVNSSENQDQMESAVSNIPWNHKLLEDSGSQIYKSWLERTTTLDDVNRNLNAEKIKTSTTRKPTPTQTLRRRQMNNGENEDFDEGDITGYASISNTPQDNSGMFAIPNRWPPEVNQNTPLSPVTALHKNAYEHSYDDYSQPSQSYAQHSHPVSTSDSKQTKEISLKDITDIALTTLAFLSFGMFILQVLMCITMDDSNNTMFLPMDVTNPGTTGDGTEEIRRRRRSISQQSKHRLTMVNEVARRVLFSIDAALLYSKHDESSCHLWALCENNSFARKQHGGQKFWFPIWSLGVSWLPSHVLTTNQPKKFLLTMQSLKAITVGLTGQTCNAYKAESCNLLSETGKNSTKQ